MTESERAQVVAALEAVSNEYICESVHHAKRDQHQLGEPCPVEQRIRGALAIMRREREPVGYALMSTHDGSIMFDKIAACGWHNFDRKLDALKAEAWVEKGRADIVPLYKD